MAFPVRIHFDNSAGFGTPRLHAWYDRSALTHDQAQAGTDSFGPYFDVDAVRNFVRFKFRDDAIGRWEDDGLAREAWPLPPPGGRDEIWCKGDRAFVYHGVPKPLQPIVASQMVRGVPIAPGSYVPGTGGLSGLGALPVASGGVLFGFYHPNAARVYVAGDFTFAKWSTRPTAKVWQCCSTRYSTIPITISIRYGR